MWKSYHALPDLFAQLGLPNDEHSINEFIRMHRSLSQDIKLHEAPWWTPAQASFLKEAIDENADWAIIVDGLDALLRG